MQALAAIAVLTLIGASVFVAVRLILLHRRTGGRPELMLGIMLLLSVGVGYPANIAAGQVDPAWARPVVALASVSTSVGFCFLFLFTWRVFQPTAIWARVFVALGLLALAVGALDGCIRAVRFGYVSFFELSLVQMMLPMVPVMLCYMWTAWESLRYYRTMQRRVALGLASPVVADRFRLWGIMGICATCGVGLNVVGAMLGIDGLSSPAILLGSGCIGMAQAVTLTLAFVPPRAYVRHVEARAAAAAA